MKHSHIKYTILICSYNAEERIIPTLEHLLALDYPQENWELVLVDNASSDDTACRVADFWQAQPAAPSLKLLSEPRPGKQNALWRGFEACQGEYILICDDDNWLAPQYLQVADATLAEIGQPVILGGACSPQPEMDWGQLPPFFFSHGYWLALGASSLALEDITKKQGWVMGAGSIVPKAAIETLQSLNFKQALSMVRGELILNGEDVEFCYALSLCGWRIYSQPKMQFKHYIPAQRVSESYIERLQKANQLALPLLKKYIRLRQLLAQPPGLSRLRSALLFFVREPDRINGEALLFALLGKAIPYKHLPTYLLRIKRLN